MRNYELVYVVKPNSDEETREAVLNKVKEVVATEGEIVKVDTWGTKKLAYPIAKFTEGFYVLVNFKSAVDVPKEIDRNLKINENVIRHMIVVA
ncbi:30S ribosomal protein S6 [Clostridioides difficile]|uniref:30S ribosomal protein S6 n=1 Tax=unclassified Clostridioides TaxID=2635829 RepID=UPI001D0C875F|nr:30S ribosomal protein S6 [Clostridioides sp. ZZV15-6388]MCC0637704.1 30S ribosomal protein S6 [Clostridioides sp. ES-S-0001-02]MCC0641362.1 30S ribosomal protein S6 [Clostridioides sp. ES-S-0049-03]MCC0647389.1 30S ribosomal protein S6 [Clostridioides sp. ZZV15-6598]MCC0653928.1 30S ribosomal protein S6 [Clostridioides sp. ES-S-0001-03]MCC0658149.1 30S ribosomal protein S6 [Clostridioides sp. ES-S-0123-01]MCC0663089.1 30S ribosomal protein S6 [Clostridioides sp. ZZV15-6597]MCC0670875.1 30